jgi:tetratricopeptide (TPR) repeat protein
MKRFIFSTVAFLFVISLAAIAGEEKPPADKPAPKLEPLAVKAAGKIVFDGKVAEGEYKDAAAFEVALPEKKKAKIFIAHYQGFMYVAFDVHEPFFIHPNPRVLFSPNGVSFTFTLEDDEEQEFIFKPYGVRSPVLEQKLGGNATELEGWAAKEDFTTIGRWHAEMKLNISILGLRPDSGDKGAFSVEISGMPFNRMGKPGVTRYPAVGARALTSSDKWGKVKVYDEEEEDLEKIQERMAERRKLFQEFRTGLQVGQFDKVKEAGRKLIEKNPGCFIVYQVFGELAEYKDRDEKKARAFYDKALKANASNRMARKKLADFHLKRNEKEKALAFYKEVAETVPNDPAGFFARMEMARIYAYYYGDRENAVALLKK